jgi:RimJ/RimL family protein N-acetyltransferase
MPSAIRPARPPEQVAAGPLMLRRVHADDAGAIAVAVGASLEHLRPWMPWATPEAADLRSQLVRVAEADELWESGTGFIYVMIARDAGPPGQDGPGMVRDPDGEFVGTIGLHRRPADDAVEIGYWTVAGRTRRGYATAAARAMTEVALALAGARRVEIHCDEANTASAGVPRKLGYRLDRVEKHEKEAPGEQGRRMIWVWDPAEGPRAGGEGTGPSAIGGFQGGRSPGPAGPRAAGPPDGHAAREGAW